MNEKKQIVAAFDFDGTLTYRDLLLPFLIYLAGEQQTYLSVLSSLPQVIQGYFREDLRQEAKEAILTKLIKDKPMSEIRAKGEQFALGPVEKELRQEGMEKLRWHQQQGHRCILISANLNSFLEPWAFQAGFLDLICSKLAVDSNQCATGKLVGLNCRGPEKVRRLSELLGPKENYILYAYGDSKGDKELMAMADYPFYRCFS
jgi:phosphatidylglycerophosphatase C